jgi:hypothetical protein
MYTDSPETFNEVRDTLVYDFRKLLKEFSASHGNSFLKQEPTMTFSTLSDEMVHKKQQGYFSFLPFCHYLIWFTSVTAGFRT